MNSTVVMIGVRLVRLPWIVYQNVHLNSLMRFTKFDCIVSQCETTETTAQNPAVSGENKQDAYNNNVRQQLAVRQGLP